MSVKQLVMEYAISLQRAIEYHCRGECVPDWIAKECPYHAKKLNDHLAAEANAKAELEAE